MDRFCVGLACLLMIGSVALAEQESKPADAAQSPKEMLKDEDAAARAGNVERDLSFYRATDEKEKKLADAIAHADVELAHLQKAVEQKFGKELGQAVVHAAGAQDLDDVEAANVKIEGDKATVEWKRKDSQPLSLVKVDGKWKISLSDLLQGMDAQEVGKLTDAMQQLSKQLTFISTRVEQGKYRSGEGVRDRIEELTNELFNGDHQGAAT